MEVPGRALVPAGRGRPGHRGDPRQRRDHRVRAGLAADRQGHPGGAGGAEGLAGGRPGDRRAALTGVPDNRVNKRRRRGSQPPYPSVH
ncbi:DNA-directed RNA polymerase III 47 kDa polypeptide [Streptomyces misionensis JCM 4497]